MRRREFITLIGAAAAWPLAGWAQQGDQMRRVGVLIGIAANDPDAQTRLAAFVQNLQQLGWTDGRNVRIDYRWGGGDADRVRKYAAALLALRPDLVFASGGAVEELLRRPALCRLCSQSSPIQSAPASSIVCRGQS